MKPEPLTKEKIGYDELTPTFDKEDVRSAYLWAVEKLNSAKENSDEIAMKQGLGLISLGEVNRVLKKAFPAVSA